MDKTEALKVASIYAAALKNKFDYQRVILFGSYAKGTFREESDIDIAVVFNDYDSAIDMQFELMKIRRSIDSRIEPHPFRVADFNPSNPIVYEILKFGQDVNPLVA